MEGFDATKRDAINIDFGPRNQLRPPLNDKVDAAWNQIARAVSKRTGMRRNINIRNINVTVALAIHHCGCSAVCGLTHKSLRKAR
jgi:hypothetical protein